MRSGLCFSTLQLRDILPILSKTATLFYRPALADDDMLDAAGGFRFL